MPRRATSPFDRPPARWWVVFALLVALPAVVLAVAGLRAISADEIERADRLRQQAASTARLIDTAFAAQLDRAAAAADDGPPKPAMTVSLRDEGGSVIFPRHRVFVAGYGVVPAAAAGPRAGGLPDDILAAVASAAPRPAARHIARLREALRRLRAGTWWLHLDQRRAYDAELTRLVEQAGIGDAAARDAQLDTLTRAFAVVSSLPAPDATTGAVSTATNGDVTLVT
jgi:hypothetical protein